MAAPLSLSSLGLDLPPASPGNAAGTFALTGQAAPGTPSYNPSWYAKTDIYWDPSGANGGSDENTGDEGSPLLTSAEVVRRYGSSCPQMNYGQSVTIHKLSAQAPNTDPLFLIADCSGGGYLALIDTLVEYAAPSTAGVVTLLDKALGTDMTVSGLARGITAGMLVHNSTSGSYAFITSVALGVATLSQPIPDALVNAVGLPSPSLATNWASGDSLTVYNVPNLTNVKAFRARGGDTAPSGSFTLSWMQFTQVANASVDSEFYQVDESVSVLSCCYVAPTYFLENNMGGSRLLGCLFAASLILTGSIQVYAGFVTGNLIAGCASLAPDFDGNVSIAGGISTNGGTVFFGSVHVAQGIQVRASVLQLAGPLWGSAALNVVPGGTVYIINTTAVLALLNTGVLVFGGVLFTGTAYNPGTGLWTSGIALTAANIDANHGLQDPAIGARFCLNS
jgi:hypothetical protein